MISSLPIIFTENLSPMNKSHVKAIYVRAQVFCSLFMYWTLPSTLYALISSFTSLHPPGKANPLTFNLQHVYMSTPSNGILFANIRDPKHVQALGHHSFKIEIPLTRRLTIPRASLGPFQTAREHSRVYGESTVLDWLEDQVDGPDVSSKDVLATLAKMTANAYLQVADQDWYDLSHQWNQVRSCCLLISSFLV